MGKKVKPKYRVLIVDDQRDVRTVLTSSIESLGSDFQVLTVPSGEEAVLELSAQKFDLLVTDVRLPGISGLDVLRRVRASQPNLKVILITGILDPVIRRNVADAGADAFFLKPIEVADFLDAVERCLGIVSDTMPPSSLLEHPASMQASDEGVSDRLANLRRELGAFSTVLLDERGRVVAQSGELPGQNTAADALFQALMVGFSAGMKVSHYLGATRPESMTYYGGTKYALFFAPVSTSHALLVATNAVQLDEQITQTMQAVYTALFELQNILERIGISVRTEEPLALGDEVAPVGDDEEDFVEDEEHAPILDAIFENVPEKISQDLDAFWNALADDATGETSSADVLTYEQASQLGLTPPKDQE